MNRTQERPRARHVRTDQAGG